MVNVLLNEIQRVKLRQPQGVIEGYLAVWGDSDHRDSYGTYFDASRPPEMALEFMPFPLMYEHAQDGNVRKEIIGRVTEYWVDETGIAYRAVLDPECLYFRALLADIQAGKLGTSTATSDHLMEFDADGRFVTWILTEVSLTENPSESRMPAVALIRSSPAGARGARDASADAGKSTPRTTIITTPQTTGATRSDLPMNIEQIVADLIAQGATAQQIVQALLAAGVTTDDMQAVIAQMAQPSGMLSTPADGTATTAAAPTNGGQEIAQINATAGLNLAEFAAALQTIQQQREQQATVEEMRSQLAAQAQQLEAMRRMMQTAPAVQTPAGNGGGNGNGQNIPALRTTDRRFDGLTLDEMLVGWAMLKGDMPKNQRNRYRESDIPITAEYLRAMAMKFHAEAVRSPNSYYATMVNLRSVPFRANEIMQSNLPGFGDEWVSEAWSGRLWEDVRISTIWQEFASRGLVEIEIPQGTDTINVPTEGSDPVVYHVAQTTDEHSTGIPDARLRSSRPSTGTKPLKAEKIGVAVAWAGELEEDSIIPFLPEQRRKTRVAVDEAIEFIMINGDVTLLPNTNINLVDGTPLPDEKYTTFDGFLKLALVTNTQNSHDALNGFDHNSFRRLLKLLGPNGKLSKDRSQVVFIVDNMTHEAAISIPAFMTKDVYSNATIESGVLTNAYGVDILITGQMELANTAGRVSANSVNNTRGRINLVRPDRWTVGWKRRVTTEVERHVRADVTEIVTFLRLGMTYQTIEAAAAAYNLAV